MYLPRGHISDVGNDFDELFYHFAFNLLFFIVREENHFLGTETQIYQFIRRINGHSGHGYNKIVDILAKQGTEK